MKNHEIMHGLIAHKTRNVYTERMLTLIRSFFSIAIVAEFVHRKIPVDPMQFTAYLL